jgi:hypothetical protein
MGQSRKFLKKGYRVKMVVIGKVSVRERRISGARVSTHRPAEARAAGAYESVPGLRIV